MKKFIHAGPGRLTTPQSLPYCGAYLFAKLKIDSMDICLARPSLAFSDPRDSFYECSFGFSDCFIN
jgi:hypothetical protein